MQVADPSTTATRGLRSGRLARCARSRHGRDRERGSTGCRGRCCRLGRSGHGVWRLGRTRRHDRRGGDRRRGLGYGRERLARCRNRLIRSGNRLTRCRNRLIWRCRRERATMGRLMRCRRRRRRWLPGGGSSRVVELSEMERPGEVGLGLPEARNRITGMRQRTHGSAGDGAGSGDRGKCPRVAPGLALRDERVDVLTEEGTGRRRIGDLAGTGTPADVDEQQHQADHRRDHAGDRQPHLPRHQSDDEESERRDRGDNSGNQHDSVPQSALSRARDPGTPRNR